MAESIEQACDASVNGHRPDTDPALYSSLNEAQQAIIHALEYRQRIQALVSHAADKVYGGLHILHEAWTKHQLATIYHFSPQFIEGTFVEAVTEQRLRVDMRDYLAQLRLIIRGRPELAPLMGNVFHGQTVEDLQKTYYPEPQWAVHGLLPEGCILLAGKPKHGKSYLALTWALAVAKQYKCMDHYQVTTGDVLYFSLEDYAKRVQKRVERLYTTPSHRHTVEFFYHAPKMSGGFGQRLEATLKGRRSVRLVIIDTLRCIRDTQNGQYNLYQEDSDFLGGLNQCAQDMNTTVLILHHTRKAKSDDVFDEISGTGGLRGATSANMVLEDTGGSGDADGMLHIEGKDYDHTMHVAMKRNEDGSWMYVGEGEVWQLRANKMNILTAIRNLGDAALPKEIWEESKIPSYGTVRSMLSRMASLGEVGKSQKGVYFVIDSEVMA